MFAYCINWFCVALFSDNVFRAGKKEKIKKKQFHEKFRKKHPSSRLKKSVLKHHKVRFLFLAAFMVPDIFTVHH